MYTDRHLFFIVELIQVAFGQLAASRQYVFTKIKRLPLLLTRTLMFLGCFSKSLALNISISASFEKFMLDSNFTNL
jgi:hypothetical protein